MNSDLAVELWSLFRTCDEWLASDGDDELFFRLEQCVQRVWTVSSRAVNESLLAALDECVRQRGASGEAGRRFFGGSDVG